MTLRYKNGEVYDNVKDGKQIAWTIALGTFGVVIFCLGFAFLVAWFMTK